MLNNTLLSQQHVSVYVYVYVCMCTFHVLEKTIYSKGLNLKVFSFFLLA